MRQKQKKKCFTVYVNLCDFSNLKEGEHSRCNGLERQNNTNKKTMNEQFTYQTHTEHMPSQLGTFYVIGYGFYIAAKRSRLQSTNRLSIVSKQMTVIAVFFCIIGFFFSLASVHDSTNKLLADRNVCTMNRPNHIHLDDFSIVFSTHLFFRIFFSLLFLK